MILHLQPKIAAIIQKLKYFRLPSAEVAENKVIAMAQDILAAWRTVAKWSKKTKHLFQRQLSENACVSSWQITADQFTGKSIIVKASIRRT
jgi:hypothetical protein